MTNVELNAILYYADFLSLKEQSKPITDNCKYFFVHGTPINAAFIIDKQPWFDENNAYFKQALDEYYLLKDKFGDEGAASFIEDICCLRVAGCVDAIRMLKLIHFYSDKKERKQAFKDYYNWLESQVYTHLTKDEHGNFQRTQCSREIARAEQETETQPEVEYKVCV